MDSWEDFDDNVPVVPQVVLPQKSQWEDEDEPEDPNAGKTPAEIAAEAEKKRKAEEARRLKAAKDIERAQMRAQAEEEALRMANETPEERALRERRAVEEADNSLADELFGGSAAGRSTKLTSPSMAKASSGVAGFPLKSSADYMIAAKKMGQEMKKGKAQDVCNFISDLLAKGAKEPLGVDEVNDLIKKLQSLLVEKQRQADANRNKAAAKQKALSAQKKEHKQKNAKHAELFGGDYDYDEDPDADKYYGLEDEFM